MLNKPNTEDAARLTMGAIELSDRDKAEIEAEYQRNLPKGPMITTFAVLAVGILLYAWLF